MEEFVELTATKAHKVAQEAKSKSTLAARWNAVMLEIKKAAELGYFQLATLAEKDILQSLEKKGFKVAYNQYVGWCMPTQCLIEW